MNNIRNNPVVRNLCLTVMLISHISVILFYFILIQPEIKISNQQTGSQYFVSSNDISTWANNGNQKNFQFQVFVFLGLLGFFFLHRQIMVPENQKCRLFSHVVKVFRLSPTYILHRVLII